MIFGHALQLVLGNRRDAARIAAVPMAALYLVSWAILGASGFTVTTGSAGPASVVAGGGTLSGTAALALWLVWLVVTAWVFVAWHRFILLEAYPAGWMPPFRSGEILGYLGRMVMLMGLSIALMVPVGIVVVLAVGAAGGGVLALLLGVFGLLAVCVAVWRVTPILPAAAIGEPLTFRDAWDATRGTTGVIVSILFIGMILQLVLQLVAAIAAAILVPLGILVAYAITVFMQLLGASLLTSFYGHYVQGRALR